ncbi:HD domain-containing protein [Shimazuella kribbensis]|uniref:HD domain-containing protein n=1 Tax=Shimazuella kribbensis TaxID=139808 RepID=UPI0003FEC8B5|nr:HD domain-containing protein [Shimazuella kribbensis]
MHLLEKAILIATNAHKGQVDKGGNPYILHPLAVMSRLSSIEAKIVGVLHDVIEDTPITLEQLKAEDFPHYILDPLCLLTHDPKEDYFTYIERISNNPLAKQVKIADLEENMNLQRIPNPSNRDQERVQKYQRAYRMLTDKI